MISASLLILLSSLGDSTQAMSGVVVDSQPREPKILPATDSVRSSSMGLSLGMTMGWASVPSVYLGQGPQQRHLIQSSETMAARNVNFTAGIVSDHLRASVNLAVLTAKGGGLSADLGANTIAYQSVDGLQFGLNFDALGGQPSSSLRPSIHLGIQRLDLDRVVKFDSRPVSELDRFRTANNASTLKETKFGQSGFLWDIGVGLEVGLSSHMAMVAQAGVLGAGSLTSSSLKHEIKSEFIDASQFWSPYLRVGFQFQNLVPVPKAKSATPSPAKTKNVVAPQSLSAPTAASPESTTPAAVPGQSKPKESEQTPEQPSTRRMGVLKALP